jgi:two-component system sensor histidine kinase HydH
MRRLQLQLVFVLVAAILVTILSAVLIASAIRGAERVVVGDTRRTLDAADAELALQYSYRVSSDSGWDQLPASARDISLRAISQITLRSYPGVEGGFYAGSQFLGYSYPTHGSGNLKVDVPEAERPEIEGTIRQAEKAGKGERILRGSRDIVLIDAVSQGDHVSWTMKRLSGITDAGEKRRSALLVGLVIAALASVIGTLATVIGLRKGIAEIQTGLSRLETDFAFDLPVSGGELGSISRSVNRVAGTRRSLEAELRRADRLRAVGRMAASMAHEIRNPLNGIRLTMQMLKQKLGANAIQPGDLDLVIGEVDRLNALLSDLLAFREARKPSLEAQKLLPILERCVDLLRLQAQERDVGMHIQVDDPEASAAVDEKQLTQVLTNLVLNALTAVPEKGTIDVRLSRKGKGFSIDVHDSGPGVAPELREHLFEPFYTTRDEGIGLGLAVSRELVSGMGGALEYRDDGTGATFVIHLPDGEAKK